MVECAGVVYLCSTTRTSLNSLPPRGSELMLYTYLNIRAGAVDLFGFSTLLAGAAWCSHLCYFGVWDASAAKSCAGGPRGLTAIKNSGSANADSGRERSTKTIARSNGKKRFPTVFLLATIIGMFSLLFFRAQKCIGFIVAMPYKYDT